MNRGRGLWTGTSALVGFLIAGFTAFTFTVAIAFAIQAVATVGLMRLFGTALHNDKSKSG